jgi:hypothetical protein
VHPTVERDTPAKAFLEIEEELQFFRRGVHRRSCAN